MIEGRGLESKIDQKTIISPLENMPVNLFLPQKSMSMPDNKAQIMGNLRLSKVDGPKGLKSAPQTLNHLPLGG